MENLTELEAALVAAIFFIVSPEKTIDHLTVVRRENTGVGRFTYLEDNGPRAGVPDGAYSADFTVVMDGLESQSSQALLPGQLDYFLFFTNGLADMS